MSCFYHSDRTQFSSCMSCQHPLCEPCSRTVGAAVYCERCLSARLAAANTPSSESSYSTPSSASPLLAAFLGFIPGVGAMYNGQYAKGIVHLAVFAVLVSLSNTSGIFGLFITGWIFYQVIEAYHTAHARRIGAPLPNPFGLNDIVERLSFTRSSSSTTSPEPSVSEPANSTTLSDVETKDATVSTEMAPLTRRNFPTGSILLILLGILLFLKSSGWFDRVSIERILPFVLIALGIWFFLRKWNASGKTEDTDEIFNTLRLYNALRGTVWIFLLGILFLLDSFNILSWSHSWPLIVIVAGLMALFERCTEGQPPYRSPSYPSVPRPEAGS